MYLLLSIIHLLFIYASYMVHSYILLGFFILSFFILLFYFSPLFFIKGTHASKKGLLSFNSDTISTAGSYTLLLPVILFYIAIYGLVYSIFWSIGNITHYHTLIASVIYLLFISYYLIIHSTNDVFYELLRYHTIVVIFSWLSVWLSRELLQSSISIFFIILLGFSLITSLQILSEYKSLEKKDILFYLFFLLGFITFIFLLISYFWEVSLFILAGVALGYACTVFFMFPGVSIFSVYTDTTKYFSIFMVYIVLALWYFFLFEDDLIRAFLVISPIILFFLYIHTLYENYISYIFAILSIFLLYTSIFHTLLFSSFSSAFLFIFFLPALLIGSTYFIKQKHSLDFLILHYASIFLSVGFSLYYLFIIALLPDLLFLSSLFILGVSTLSFMSYFRFRFDA